MDSTCGTKGKTGVCEWRPPHNRKAEAPNLVGLGIGYLSGAGVDQMSQPSE